jgi:hypothetical protein
MRRRCGDIATAASGLRAKKGADEFSNDIRD